MRKKGVFIVLSGLALVALISIMFVFVFPSKAVVIFFFKQSISRENSTGVDWLSEDRSKVCFQNPNTVEFIFKSLNEATMTDVTGTASSTWPLPMYYVGDVLIGGNETIIKTLGFKTFHFSFAAKSRRLFAEYILAIQTNGEHFGIETGTQ